MNPEISDLFKEEFSDDEIDLEHSDTASQILQAMDDDMNYDPDKLWTIFEPETVMLPTSPNKLKDKIFEEDEDKNDEDDVDYKNNFCSDEINTNTECTPCYSYETDEQLEENLTEEQLNRMVDGCTEEEGNMQTDQDTDVSMLDGIDTIIAKKRHEEKAITFSFDDVKSKENHILKEHTSLEKSFWMPEEISSESEEDEPSDSSLKNIPSQSKHVMYVPIARDDLREFTEEDQEQVEESLADYPSDLSHSESEECNETKSNHQSTLIETDFKENLDTTETDDFPIKEERHDQKRHINVPTLGSTQKKDMEDEAISKNEFDLNEIILKNKEDLSFRKEDIYEEDIHVLQPNKNSPEVHNFNTKNILHHNDVTDQAHPESNTSQDETNIFSEMQTKDADTLIQEMLRSSKLFTDEDNLHLDKYDWNLTEEEFNINLENKEDLEIYQENKRDWELDKARIDAFYRFFGDQDETNHQLNKNQKVRFELDHESFEFEEDSDSSDETEGEPAEPVSTIKSKCHTVLKSVLALGLVTGIGLVYFWWATEDLDWTHWIH